MTYKKLIPFINAENEIDYQILQLAEHYSHSGADELFVYQYAKSEKEKEAFLVLLKQIAKKIDIPFLAGVYVERFEDAKKAFYTGATRIVIRYETLKNKEVLKEITDRFGKDKVILELDEKDFYQKKDWGVETLLVKHISITNRVQEALGEFVGTVIIRDDLVRNDLESLLTLPNTEAVSTNYFQNKEIMKAKLALLEKGISINTFTSSVQFADFKVGPDGLIPVVVQDYKTADVLMLAYMNEESFAATLKTGKMTYYSRSRQELWCKGDTSGHVQYVKNLFIDCDQDTILAKVRQEGAACHTGSKTCFYTPLASKEYDDTNPSTVLNDVFGVILDRKKNPKEGSYTNYLFDKGIDKILKKCGEEATEMVIAAKNPDAEELKYEISDFLYHMMVLMAECNLDWDDVMSELAHR